MDDNKNKQNPGQPSENNLYYDTLLNAEDYKPNSGVDENGNPLANEGKNTGSGIESAVGNNGEPIGYSWEKQAESKANKTYEQEVNNAKQNLLTNRQTLENNAVNYQAEADMMKYQNNQNAEKVGWTGGYVLDQNRQMDYLKASIQAQMYGAMELQKYGYDSALAAARLSYDLNQQEYAHQYYQEAVSQALSEAQLTGTYFSAETKDMMSQLAVAKQKQEDQSLPQEERDQAKRLEDQIESWFSSNGISKEGVKTLEAWQQESSLELQRSQEMWTRYQAALETAKQDLSENSSLFLQLDENGNVMFDGNNALTGNWETYSGSDIVKYLQEDKSDQRKQQFYSYIEQQLGNQSSAAFVSWLQSNGYQTKDEQGNITNTSGESYGDLYGQYLAESNVFADFINKKFKTANEEEKEILAQKLDGFDITVTLPDGTSKTYTLHMTDENGAQVSGSQSSGSSNSESKKGYISDNIQVGTLLNGLFGDYTNKENLTDLEKTYQGIQELLNQITNGDYSSEEGWAKTIRNIQNFAAAGSLRDIMSLFGNIWKEAGADWSSNARRYEALTDIYKTIESTLGKTNLEKIFTLAKEFNKMEARDKASLSDAKRQQYQNAVDFMNKIDKLKAARDYYGRNDSMPFTWEYVADTWKNVGHDWSHMNNFGDFAGALTGTLNAVGTSVISGIAGFFKNLFTWSW